MERNGFNPSSFETSGDKPDVSTEKSKAKKKKSGEPINRQPETEKKVEKRESFADRFKAAIGEKVVEEKPEASKQAEQADEKPNTEADVESADIAEGNETANEVGAEVDGNTAETDITPEENREVNERLLEANVEQLKAEIAATDDEVEQAASQAAIEAITGLSLDKEAAELAPEELAALSPPEHNEAVFEDEDAPLPFEDEGDVPLGNAAGSGTGNGAGRLGGTPPAGATPPRPPRPPLPPIPGPRFPATNGNTLPSAPNIVPTKVPEYQPDYRENPNRTYLLVGGVVGYLIGRRRGRIKTEKRMNVVVKKLESQVEAKQQIINQQIEVAKQKARQEFWQKKAPPAEARNPINRTEGPTMAERRRPTVPAAEKPATAPLETGAKNYESRPEKLSRNIELRDEDIRRLSETITIGATNLRKIHEAKLITDGGLRRLVNEHLQGKDIRRGLAREFLTKELSYERDPHFRDIVPLEAVGKRPGAAGTSDQSVAGQVVTSAATQTAPVAPNKAARKPIRVKQKRSQVSTGVLTVLSIVALFLAAYAVWLGLMR